MLDGLKTRQDYALRVRMNVSVDQVKRKVFSWTGFGMNMEINILIKEEVELHVSEIHSCQQVERAEA